MFGLFGKQTSAPPPQQQQQQTQTPPGGQQQQQQTPPAGQHQQQQQQQVPAPQQQQQQQTISMADMLSESNRENPIEYAARMLDVFSQASDRVDPTQGQQIQINPTALTEALAGIDMTNGADLQKLFESQNDPTAFGSELKGLLQQVSQNTIATMVPLINSLVSQAVTQAQQQTLQMSQQAVTVDNLVSSFRNAHEYANNPVVSRMLTGMAEVMVQNSPPGTSIQALVDALHTTMSGMSLATGGNQRQSNSPVKGGQTDFSGLFKA